MGLVFLLHAGLVLLLNLFSNGFRIALSIPLEDAQCCENYRGIKLISHTMKVWKRIIKARLRDRVEISNQQYRFMPGKGTTDAMFALRMLMKKYRKGQRELHCVFVDLEKALRQGFAKRAVALYEKIRNSEKGLCDLYRICMREAKQW